MIDRELRDLVRRMCEENPLWGSPRIHGELLKLGFDVAQSTESGGLPPQPGSRPFSFSTFTASGMVRNFISALAASGFGAAAWYATE